ncbi:ABC transporter permease [Acidobacteriota bacterium]
MLKNYFKIAWRTVQRHKGYSFINLFGLALGLACCIFILFWIQDEIQYNTFHEKIDNLYMVRAWSLYGDQRSAHSGTPPALGPAIKDEYPEILNSARINNGQGEMVLTYDENHFFENVQMADPEIFELFSFPFIQGDPKSVFSDPFAMVITEEVSKRIFEQNDSIGKILTVDNKYDFKIVGVLKDLPHNSTIQFKVWIPLTFSNEIWRPDYTKSWSNASFVTYVQLEENASFQDLSQKIKGRIIQSNRDTQMEPFLIPFSHVYLELYGRKSQIRIFTLIALFVLLIACFNFINLTTARSAKRAKEVGLRKVVGANRQQLVKQFFGESILLTILALFLAAVFIIVFLPLFRNLSGKPLNLYQLMDVKFLLSIAGMTVLTGVISGIYPALFLSSFQPIQIMKGQFSTGSKGNIFRKILVVCQFVFSIILIICTTLLYNQVHFMQNKGLGFEKEQLIYTRLKGNLHENFEVLKNELQKDPNVSHVTFTSRTPVYVGTNGHGWDWEGREPTIDPLVTYFAVEPNFLEAFEMEMSRGKFFADGQKNRNNVVINERFAEIIGLDNPVGRGLRNGENMYTILGVVKDFHFKPIHNEIGPMMLYYGDTGDLLEYNYMFVKIPPDKMTQTIGYIEDTVKTLNPEFPFVYSFLDEDYGRLYSSEERIGAIVRTFAFLAVFVSCLGLFGLASFMAERRTKEIGIRKVLGASVSGIIFILCREFTKWVVFANIFAWPVAYFVMHNWLQKFPYRISIGFGIFFLSGFVTLLIALLTVSYQSIRAALSNPVVSLKYE